MVKRINQASISSENFSIKSAFDRLLGSEGILTPYIQWFEGMAPKISDRLQSEDRKTVYIELSPSHFIQLPSNWIEDGVVYECKIGWESEPRFRFRLGKNRKLHKLKTNKNPRQTDEHMDEHIDTDQVDQVGSKGAYYKPRSIIISIADQQTIGKRERVMDNVKRIAVKLTKK